MLDFTNTHFVDETLLTRYHQDLINFLSDNYLNKSGGTMNGQINSCSIIPKSGVHALGSSDYKWQYGYINYIYTSRTYVSDSIRPTGTVTSGVSATNIGATDEFFNTLYVKDIISYGGTIRAASTNGTGSALNIGSSTYPANKIYSTYINIASAGEIKPLTNNNGKIGTSSKYFNESYVYYAYSQYVRPIIAYDGSTSYPASFLGTSLNYWYYAYIYQLLPGTSGGYIGTSSNRWNTIYANYGYATNGWSTSCDEKLKRDIKDVNVLDKLKNLRVKKFKYSQKAIKEKQWNEAEDKKMFSELSKGNRNYKRPETPKFEDDENSPDYIMAMAGEFNKAFGLDGDNEDTINYTNAIGVALRAIQELSEQVDDLKRKLNDKNKK